MDVVHRGACGLLALPASACARTCSQARCTVCAAACLSPDHLTSAVTAAGSPADSVREWGGTISATQLACMTKVHVMQIVQLLDTG